MLSSKFWRKKKKKKKKKIAWGLNPWPSADHADADLTELPRPAYMFCDFWLGSQRGCGVLAKVIMQANIALSYIACDMLWANENSKLE